MEKIIKRKNIITLGLVVVLALFIITGCGKKDTKDEKVDMQGSVFKSEIKLPDYKGYNVSSSDVQVTDEEVETEINNLLWCFAKENQYDKGQVASSDLINIDYEGLIDGKKIEDQSGTNKNIMVEKNNFLAGFAEELVGKNIGASVIINQKFPDVEKYGDNRNKDITYTVKINYIKRLEAPKLEDEGIVSNWTSRDAVAENIYSENIDYFIDQNYMEYIGKNANQVKEVAKNRLLVRKTLKALNQSLIKDIEINYNRSEVAEELANQKKVYIDYCKENDLKISEYVEKYFDMTEEEFDEKLKESVQDNIKMWLVVQEIARKDNILISNDEYKSYMKDVIVIKGYKDEDEFYDENDKQAVVDVMISNKVLQYLAKQCTIK